MVEHDEKVQTVWEKARVMADRDPTEWRQDQCGAWMRREHYNNAKSEYGWRILKTAPGATSGDGALEAFHWNNGYDIANHTPKCEVSADRAHLAPGQRMGQPRNEGDYHAE